MKTYQLIKQNQVSHETKGITDVQLFKLLSRKQEQNVKTAANKITQKQ